MHSLPALPVSLLSLLLFAKPADGWLGIHFDPDREEAVVADVIAGWPAEKAGLRPGDVLTAVGDKQTPTREDFIAAIKASKTGEDVVIKLRRGDEQTSVTVRLTDKAPPGTTPPEEAKARKPAQAPVVEGGKTPATKSASEHGYLGISVSETDGAVVVGSVKDGSPAAAAKLRAGDVIVSIGGQKLGDFDDLDAVMQKSRPGQKVPVELRSDEGTRSVTVTFGERPADADKKATPKAAEGHRTAPAPRTAQPHGGTDVEAELQALRKELAEVKKLLEELRAGQQQKGKE